MRDAYNIFGVAEAKGGAAAAVLAPDVIQVTAPDKVGHAGNVPDLEVAYAVKADFASADSLTPVIYHSDDPEGTFTECARGFAVLAPKKTQVFTLAIPKAHKPYLKAGFIPSSTGTFAASKVECWIGEGEHDDALGD